jgi:hypothetical protein
MVASWLRRYPTLTAVLWVVPVVVILVVIAGLDDDEFSHAAFHLAITLPLLAIVVTSRRWRAPEPGVGTGARRSLLIGLAFVCAGGVLEAIGAFGYEGDTRQYELVAKLHDLGLFFGPFGFLFLLVGGVLALGLRMKGANRAWWIAAAVLVVAMAVMAFGSLSGL